VVGFDTRFVPKSFSCGTVKTQLRSQRKSFSAKELYD